MNRKEAEAVMDRLRSLTGQDTLSAASVCAGCGANFIQEPSGAGFDNEQLYRWQCPRDCEEGPR